MYRINNLPNILKKNIFNKITNLSTLVNSQHVEKTYNIIEGMNHHGQYKVGVELGPKTITSSKQYKLLQSIISDKNKPSISANLYNFERLANNFWTEKYIREIQEDILYCYPITPEMKHKETVSYFNQRLFDINLQSSKEVDLTINLIGDHSGAIGTVMSSLITNPNFKLVWIDAHADINTPYTSPSGNCHGMPLSIVSGLSNEYLNKHNIFEWLKDKPKLNLNNLIYIGIRDIDKGEEEIIKTHNITVLTVEDVKNFNLIKLFKEIENRDVHISFDVDSLDPMYFNLTGTPVPNGLSGFDVNLLMRFINAKSNVFKLDICEFNPMLYDKINMDYINRNKHLEKYELDEMNKLKKTFQNMLCTNIIIHHVLAPIFNIGPVKS